MNVCKPIIVNDPPHQRAACCEECERLRRENEALRAIVNREYDRFKHLNGLLSNPAWMRDGADPFHRTLYDLWQAIKHAREIGALDGNR